MIGSRVQYMSDAFGVSPELIGSFSLGGSRAYRLGYAVNPDTEGTIYLIDLASQLLRRAEGVYLSKTVQPTESGLDYMLLLHHQAVLPHLETGQPFYLLSGYTRR